MRLCAGAAVQARLSLKESQRFGACARVSRLVREHGLEAVAAGPQSATADLERAGVGQFPSDVLSACDRRRRQYGGADRDRQAAHFGTTLISTLRAVPPRGT